MPKEVVLYVNSDESITLSGLQLVNGNFVNNATLTMSITDLNGGAIANASNINMAYIGGSSGVYTGYLPNNAGLTYGQQYFLIIIGTQGSTQIYIKELCVAVYAS